MGILEKNFSSLNRCPSLDVKSLFRKSNYIHLNKMKVFYREDMEIPFRFEPWQKNTSTH